MQEDSDMGKMKTLSAEPQTIAEEHMIHVAKLLDTYDSVLTAMLHADGGNPLTPNHIRRMLGSVETIVTEEQRDALETLLEVTSELVERLDLFARQFEEAVVALEAAS